AALEGSRGAKLSRSQVRLVRYVWMFAAALLGVLVLFPLLWMVSISFKPSAESFSGSLIPTQPTLSNFVHVFTEVPFLRYLWNSFFVSATVTVVALFFHSMAGYALARLR